MKYHIEIKGAKAQLDKILAEVSYELMDKIRHTIDHFMEVSKREDGELSITLTDFDNAEMVQGATIRPSAENIYIINELIEEILKNKVA